MYEAATHVGVPWETFKNQEWGGYPPYPSIFFTSYPALAIISIIVCRLISVLAEDQSILDFDFVTPSSWYISWFIKRWYKMQSIFLARATTATLCPFLALILRKNLLSFDPLFLSAAWATWTSIQRICFEPCFVILPVMSLSADWYTLGTIPHQK